MGKEKTFASHPANVRVDLAHYLACYRVYGIVAGGLCLVGVLGAAIWWNWMPLLLSGVGLWQFKDHIQEVRRKFKLGDVCPAVVVSDSPYCIAVYTDLTRSHRPRPAVVVHRAPLHRMTGGPPRVGQRLATVAMYAGGRGNSDAWEEFHPTVLACGTRDMSEINRVTAKIPPQQWGNLDKALKQLTTRETGLYRLWLGGQQQ